MSLQKSANIQKGWDLVMKKKILVSLLLVLAMIMSCVPATIAADESAAASGEILSINYEKAGAQTAVVLGDTIKSINVNKTVFDNGRVDGEKKRAFVISAIFNGNDLESVATGNGFQIAPVDNQNYYSIAFNGSEKLVVPADMSGKSVKLFVLYSNADLKPLAPSKEYKYMEPLTAATYANGVKLSWTAVDGAVSYTVYRDGNAVDTVEGTEYKDIYFRTVEQMLGENTGGVPTGITSDNMAAEHSYTVKANFGDSAVSAGASATGKADPSKVMYYSLYGVTSDKYQTNDPSSNKNVFTMSASSAKMESISKGEVSNKLKITSGTETIETKITSLYTSTTRNDGMYINNFGGKTAFGLVGFKGVSGMGKTSDVTLTFAKNSFTADKSYKVLINMAAYGDCYMFSETGFVGTNKSADGYFGKAPKGTELTRVSENGEVAPIKTSDSKARIDTSADNNYYTYMFDSKVVTKNNDTTISMSAVHIANGYASHYNENGENAAIHSIGIIDPADYLE